jgi:hypothetical protein
MTTDYIDPSTLPEPYHDFIVYGGFTEPETGKNFVVIRIPRGRLAWVREVHPAINRLVRGWFPAKAKDRLWYVDGESLFKEGEPRLWDTRGLLKFEWTKEEGLVRRTQ